MVFIMLIGLCPSAGAGRVLCANKWRAGILQAQEKNLSAPIGSFLSSFFFFFIFFLEQVKFQGLPITQ